MNPIDYSLRRALCLSLIFLGLGGCAATKQEQNALPTDGSSMSEIYQQHLQRSMRQDLDNVRQNLTVTQSGEERATPVVAGMPDCEFPTLNNPKITLHVFAHLAGLDEVPIPAYRTSFALYAKTHYALAGEPGVC